MHWVQALVAPEYVVNEAQRIIPQFVVCPLSQGMALVPMTAHVESALRESEFPALDPSSPLAGDMVAGIAALAARLSALGPVVYAATFIWGGEGSQDAIVWEGGEVALALHDGKDDPSKWPDSAISRALRKVGVRAAERQDEFDAIGFGLHRSNDAWAKAHTRGA
ncbi:MULTISPECIES: hypothetical protein [unclassified Rhizobacter]|uniref:hypothetical protein n=1 Tax=unclassified Rhizobacter TaxID=2640088 RepID=UPI0012FB88B9|nr:MULTISPECIES: hypothetical protein [unclassified Rhizobacter]